MKTTTLLRKVNAAFGTLTVCLATSYLVANYQVALAYGYTDGNCANVIDERQPCPTGTNYTTHPYNGWTCRKSSAWRADFFNNTDYYNCCKYEQNLRVCIVNGAQQQAGNILYFRSMYQSMGVASCSPTQPNDYRSTDYGMCYDL